MKVKYSIASLLLLVTLASVAVGVWQANRQREKEIILDSTSDLELKKQCILKLKESGDWETLCDCLCPELGLDVGVIWVLEAIADIGDPRALEHVEDYQTWLYQDNQFWVPGKIGSCINFAIETLKKSTLKSAG